MTAPKRQNISPKAVELIRRIYMQSCVGCCWHVVLDDGNWDSIEFCKQYAREHASPDSEYPCKTNGACQELAALNVTASILRRALRTVDDEIRADIQKCGTDYAARKFA